VCIVFVFVTQGCEFSLHFNVPARIVQLKEAFQLYTSMDSMKT